MDDAPLTTDEMQALTNAGYQPVGGGNMHGDGVIWLKYRKGEEVAVKTRAEWREVIAQLKPPTEDELAFGKDAWVYCNQHLRAHETGWSSTTADKSVWLAPRESCP